MGTARQDDSVAPDLVGRFRDSIAGQITTRSLLLVVVPLGIVSVLTVVSLFVLNGRAERGLEDARQELAAETIGAERAEQARLVLARTDAFVSERVDDVVDWSRSPSLVEAAAADRPEIEQFVSLPVESVEANFDGSDLLDGTGRSSRFLRDQIVDRPSFAEVFFTDANGFNVGATNPTSDFVQSDEDWWQESWANGAFIGPLEFDESANVFSFEVAVRIDSTFGAPVGVVKAVIDASALQAFADEFASGDTTGTEVRVLNAEGLLLAETATDHDPTRVGEVASFEGDQQKAFEAARAATGADVPGEATGDFLILDDTVAGFSSTSSSRTIDRLGIAVDAEQWIAIVEQPEGQALAPLDSMETLRDDLSFSARTLSAVLLALTLLAIGAAVFVSRIMGRRIARPINQLQLEAHRVANDELPMLIKSLRSSSQQRELPVVHPIEIETQQSEVSDLAEAFNSVRSTAVHLAASQAIGRTRDVASVLMTLGRRNQQLAGRQLQFIDELEESESDPKVLHNLFQLDQLATRMRRNAESLLVLAGEEPHQAGTEPVSVDDVIRAAMSAVEDFGRVQVKATEPAAINPIVARDLSHLLAELIENATTFSAPETTVDIICSAGLDDTYTISIVDNGIGMSMEQLAKVNDQLRDPDRAEDASTRQLGFLVVGRLAQRHGIDTRLVESAAHGLTAKVTVPISCLVTETNQPPMPPATQLERSVEGPAVLDATPRQPKTVSSTGSSETIEPTESGPPLPGAEKPWYDPRDEPQTPVEKSAAFRRRPRRPPSTIGQSIEHSSSEAMRQATSVEEGRAAQVRQDLSRYTIGIEAAINHPPQDLNDEGVYRAIAVRHELQAFSGGLERGHAEMAGRTNPDEDAPSADRQDDHRTEATTDVFDEEALDDERYEA